MSKKVGKDVREVVKDADHWEQLMSPDQKRLLIVDIHLSWCGPCNVIAPNLRGLYLSVDDAPHRIAFYTADQGKIPELEKYKISCKPRFFVFLEGQLKEEIEGADFVHIESAVAKHLPAQDID